MPSPRYLIVHGHFYQPPRENPWSGSIAIEASAAPYPNWNTRINRECYAPNARARLLDNKGAIAKIINNYEYLSFNIGPTLLLWLKEKDPLTHAAIVEADKKASARRRGHGPALAQVFNHIIMPLANSRDKLTQILWGKAHFEKTFQRSPEGMWLAETAADLESLSLMAKAGLKFTILAQSQIDAIRPLDSGREAPWETLSQSPDPRRPYRIFWGRGPNDYLDAFVYDGPVSRAVAFENLLRDGASFKARLEEAFGAEEPGKPRLVNLATDGESYGHHFHFGDMTLAWVFNALESQPPDDPNPIKLTNYGEFLSLYPPNLEARLVENSSWSCCHGVERWRSDCGCATGGEPGWNQKWRAPLRDGLNWLRDELKVIFEREGGPLLKDPWAARDGYLEVTLSGYDPKVRDDFISRNALGSPDELTKEKIIKLLEAQRMGLYMFTSCGWFYNDLAGLEPAQNLRYAARAIELANEWANLDLTAGLVSRLRRAKPNDPHYPTGEDVWRELVTPARLRPGQAIAHLAATAAMKTPKALEEFVFQKPTFNPTTQEEGLTRLLTGEATIKDVRLATSEKGQVVALLGAGFELDILVTPEADLLSQAESLWTSGGAAAVKTFFLTLANSKALLFKPEDLWPSVRRIITREQVRDFFDNLIVYARKAFEGYRGLLNRYRDPGAAEAWMDRFIFRVMAEADLEKFTQTMAAGGAIDLVQLEDLIHREEAGDSDSFHLISGAVSDYLLKLLELSPSNPRPGLLSELFNLTELIGRCLPEADLWASQNLWHQLWGDLSYTRSLTPEDLILFRKVGVKLGFGLGVF
ncbi:MAG: DUF3536 domain-containing protein [Deltaproteobacteria bacterium]|nr:DUF3536 domain-containing protein [Deltaproteobacteria bacterium]